MEGVLASAARPSLSPAARSSQSRLRSRPPDRNLELNRRRAQIASTAPPIAANRRRRRRAQSSAISSARSQARLRALTRLARARLRYRTLARGRLASASSPARDLSSEAQDMRPEARDTSPKARAMSPKAARCRARARTAWVARSPLSRPFRRPTTARRAATRRPPRKGRESRFPPRRYGATSRPVALRLVPSTASDPMPRSPAPPTPPLSRRVSPASVRVDPPAAASFRRVSLLRGCTSAWRGAAQTRGAVTAARLQAPAHRIESIYSQ